MKDNILKTVILGLSIGLLVSCGNSKGESNVGALEQESPKVEKKKELASESSESTASGIGVGPIKEEIQLGPIDQKLVDKGKEIFELKCTQCHKFEKRYIGPALNCVTERRSPAWIMNMILNPEKMTKEDPIAKKLLAEYAAPMANQNISEEEARALLEYLRTKC